MGKNTVSSQGELNSGEASAVEAQNVVKIFGSGDTAVHALDDVSVTIRENEFFTLLGPSGCGKTTLLRMIAGFEHPTSGHILLNGEHIGHLPPFQRPVNTVFQNYALFPHMTVGENIGFGLEMMGRSSQDVAAAVKDMLALVRMETLGDRKTSQLSGGQQQRVALARALAPRPKVLLLDEPLSALDLKLRKEMQIELKRMQNETGITFIFVTHGQEEALTMSDRVAVMRDGKIRQIGAPREVYDHPAERFVAQFIGETNFLDAELLAVSGNVGRVRLPSGVEIPASMPAGNVAIGKVGVVVRPEHAELGPSSGTVALKGTVENIVYFGTDTHFHLRVEGNTPFVVRMQNTRDSGNSYNVGADVGVLIKENAAQVLVD